jgi:hypothetical protein
MPRVAFGLSAAALAGALLCGNAAPAAAEQSATRDLAAQSRPRIVVHPRHSYPGRNAKRHCRFWLAKEYRVSGTVITPQMRCWWR